MPDNWKSRACAQDLPAELAWRVSAGVNAADQGWR